jgi:hypothetical protein
MAQQSRRSRDRAQAILDRAAKSRSFAPRWSLVGIGDPQMRTPGYIKKEPFDLRAVNETRPQQRTVPLDAVRSRQRNVSVAAVKGKFNATGGAAPSMFEYKGQFFVDDGNHRVTAARALGQKHVTANVISLTDRPDAAKILKGIAQRQMAAKVGVAGLGLATLGGVGYAAYRKFSGDGSTPAKPGSTISPLVDRVDNDSETGAGLAQLMATSPKAEAMLGTRHYRLHRAREAAEGKAVPPPTHRPLAPGGHDGTRMTIGQHMQASGAYLNQDAKAKAQQETPAKVQTAMPTQGAPPAAKGRQTYTKLDGSTVDATDAQARKWQAQRK